MDKTVFPDVPQELDTKHFARQMKQMADDLKDVFVDVSYVKNCIDTLTNEELEKMIKHCNALIERNNIEMGGV